MSPNFVLRDTQERIWICALSKFERAAMKNFHRDQRDGFIVLVDRQGARIVADGVGFPNEVRVDPTGKWLYTNETLATRLLRYPILPGGALGEVEVVCELDETNMFDGFTLDSKGGAWITTLVSNRLWYVAPDGRPHLVIEDCDPEEVELLASYQRGAGVPLHILYEERPRKLCNISSVAFGGRDLSRIYLGSLRGESIFYFDAPVQGMRPVHWDLKPPLG